MKTLTPCNPIQVERQPRRHRRVVDRVIHIGALSADDVQPVKQLVRKDATGTVFISNNVQEVFKLKADDTGSLFVVSFFFD